ncbi:uncharacterized protein [Leuresthes tenuis]|uniref:uncharacterized protein n=1 Tax=Leuresthes tenuis TaxID=355514 RepID=UPI003B51136B
MMISVTVIITGVPVSKPRLWPLSSLADRPTCLGKPVTVRCGCIKGTGIHYAWYQRTHHMDFLLHRSSDLRLDCSTVERDSKYYCFANHDISGKESDILSVQVLMPADSDCIYALSIQGQPDNDCADRMNTSRAKTLPMTTCKSSIKVQSDGRDQFVQVNQTDLNVFFRRTWTRVPLWYTLLRCFFCILTADFVPSS